MENLTFVLHWCFKTNSSVQMPIPWLDMTMSTMKKRRWRKNPLWHALTKPLQLIHTHSDTDDSSSFASLQLCTNKSLDTVYAQSVSAFANKYLNVETPVICSLELFLFMWPSGWKSNSWQCYCSSSTVTKLQRDVFKGVKWSLKLFLFTWRALTLDEGLDIIPPVSPLTCRKHRSHTFSCV